MVNQDRETDRELDRLPVELVDRLTEPFARFLRIEALGGGILLLFTVAALVLSNSPWAHSFLSGWELPVGIRVGSFEFARSLREWINDGLMTLFFFVVALELKRELVLGELNSPRVAAFSIAAAVGGMLVPAALYLTLQLGREGMHGWGTVMVTDTAFVIGCLALLGRRIPQSLRIFMLSLAIVDDIGAILVVAIGYTSELMWGALALGALGIASVRGMALLRIRSIPLYFLVGAATWLAVDAGGIHGTITGVALGLLTPTGRWVSDDRLEAIVDRVVPEPAKDQDHQIDMTKGRKAFRERLSPVERLEMMLHPWVSFAIMPLFAFANAGMPLSSADVGSPLTFAVFVGFTIRKPVGIVAFGWLTVRSGLASRPPDMGWGMLAGGGLLAGVGFTMALFIADLAFGDALINEAKLGILSASVASASAGLVVLIWATRGKSLDRK
jgi:NhaA family Na+:H+ antiporter